MGNAIAFYVTAALILGFAMLVVTTKNTVHAVLFLVVTTSMANPRISAAVT